MGSVKVKVAPRPTSLSTHSWPPCRCTRALAMERPDFLKIAPAEEKQMIPMSEEILG